MHLGSHGLAMAAACPLSPRDCRVSHSSFSVQKGARERPLRGHYAPSIRTSAEPALRASSAADFYPTVKAALRHESANSEEDRECLGCHLGQGLAKVRLHHTNTTKAVPMLSASTPRSVFEVRLRQDVSCANSECAPKRPHSKADCLTAARRSAAAVIWKRRQMRPPFPREMKCTSDGHFTPYHIPESLARRWRWNLYSKNMAGESAVGEFTLKCNVKCCVS